MREKDSGGRRQEAAAIGALVLVLVLVSVQARAAEIPAVPSAGCKLESIDGGRRLERTIDVDGTRRVYILDVPDGAQPGKPVPLLFDFHGFQHSGAGVWKVSKFGDIAARDPFVAVYPDGVDVKLPIRGEVWEGRGWEIREVEGNRDIAFVKALLDDLEGRYCIDRARVFSTGFSNGGFFSSLLACAMADRFAAVAPVGAGPLSVPCAPRRGVPVLIHHGRLDDLIPASRARQSRDDWVRINGCRAAKGNGCATNTECRDGAVVEYCEGDYGHTWPVEATARIWEFFRKHPKKEAGTRE